MGDTVGLVEGLAVFGELEGALDGLALGELEPAPIQAHGVRLLVGYKMVHTSKC